MKESYILPAIYRDNGQSMKLVMYCYGGGGSVFENTSQAGTGTVVILF